eukprot:g5429.t1
MIKGLELLGFNCWDNQVYFSSMADATMTKRPSNSNTPLGEFALRCLETPLPWDTSCTALGRCESDMRCYNHGHGFAMVCKLGLVRDYMEIALLRFGTPTVVSVVTAFALAVLVNLYSCLFGGFSTKNRRQRCAVENKEE